MAQFVGFATSYRMVETLYIVVTLISTTRFIFAPEIKPSRYPRLYNMNSEIDDSISIVSASNLETNSTFRFEADSGREPTLRDLLYSIGSVASRTTGLHITCENGNTGSSQVSVGEEKKDFAESIRNTSIYSLVAHSNQRLNPESMLHDAHLDKQSLVKVLNERLIPLHQSKNKRGEAIYQRRVTARERLLNLLVPMRYRLVQYPRAQDLPQISVQLISNEFDTRRLERLTNNYPPSRHIALYGSQAQFIF
jgi:hypothetical protein